MTSPRISRLTRLAVVSLGVACFAGPAGGAAPPVEVTNGIANCVWLKLKAKGSGYEMRELDTGLGPKRSISANCYMQLVYMPPDAEHLYGRYGAPILCPILFTDTEVWAASPLEDSFAGTALLDGNVIAVDNYLSFTTVGGDLIQGWGTHRVLITIDKKTGLFKKATFQTLGGEMIDNSIFNETPAGVIGSYTATGSSVTADKVPQQAKDLVGDSPCTP